VLGQAGGGRGGGKEGDLGGRGGEWRRLQLWLVLKAVARSTAIEGWWDRMGGGEAT
jgi:hypothetical protein